jgi:hypothetical protein
MTSRTKHAIYGFFVALPTTEGGLNYFDDSDKEEFIKLIEGLRAVSSMSEEDVLAIELWLHAISKGDLGDYCYSNYYNMGGVRFRALAAILGGRYFLDDEATPK